MRNPVGNTAARRERAIVPAPATTSPVTGSLYRRYGKRAFDVLASLAGIVVLAPLFGLVAILVRLKLGSPVFFRQERPGLHSRPFTLVKFRTMTDARDESGNLLPPSQRLTTFGRFLRASSLDELPELINVLRGDMSLVGPRPLLTQYLDLYTPEQARRHEVKPGITGWAQVNGRNAINWEERFALDVWYVDNLSAMLDLKIIARTVLKVIRREGVSPPDSLLMEAFRGSDHGNAHATAQHLAGRDSAQP